MTARAYYNEIDQAAATVLRELIADDVIAPGDVDTRSIKDVQPDDLKGYAQCHFFAGGGLWSVASRLAGWPDDKPLWTGSCPCQPFSVAGKRAGADDPRHLWPDFFRLIRSRQPPVIMGEQVAGALGYRWFDGVCADLESENYASRAVDIPACAVDAPHIRQRLYWLAVADSQSQRRREGRAEPGVQLGRDAVAGANAPGALDHSVGARLEGHVGNGDGAAGWWVEDRSTATPDDCFMGDGAAHGRNGSFWSDAEWIMCRDQKARRTKPGLSLLADGLPGRVGLWRIAGNAISPVLAAEVIGAFLDTERAAA